MCNFKREGFHRRRTWRNDPRTEVHGDVVKRLQWQEKTDRTQGEQIRPSEEQRGAMNRATIESLGVKKKETHSGIVRNEGRDVEKTETERISQPALVKMPT